MKKTLWLFVHKIPWKPILIWGPFVLIALVLTFYLVENWRGSRAWDDAQKLAAKENVSLDWLDYAPPEIPRDNNLLHAPPLASGTIAGFQLYLHRTGIPELSDDRDDFKIHYWRAQPPDLRLWLEPSRRPTTQEEAAQQLDRILAPRKAELDELCSHLPEQELTLPLLPDQFNSGGNPFQFSRVPSDFIAEIALDDALIAIALGDNERVQERMSLLATCFNAKSYPCLVQMLFDRFYLEGIDEIVWNLVKNETLSTSQTRSLLTRLESLSLAAKLPRHMKGEMAYGVHSLRALKENRELPAALIPEGWFNLALAEKVVPTLQASKGLTPKRSQDCRELQRRFHEAKPSFLESPLDSILLNSSTAWSKALEEIQVAETIHQLTLIGLQLELFNDRHGHYPEMLAELENEKGEPLPHDFFSGKPYRYRRKADGTPHLWSVGRNRVDENGLPNRLDKEGDLVWMLTPIAGLSDTEWRRALRQHSGNRG